jgi:hypothetical protein
MALQNQMIATYLLRTSVTSTHPFQQLIPAMGFFMKFEEINKIFTGLEKNGTEYKHSDPDFRLFVKDECVFYDAGGDEVFIAKVRAVANRASALMNDISRVSAGLKQVQPRSRSPSPASRVDGDKKDLKVQLPQGGRGGKGGKGRGRGRGEIHEGGRGLGKATETEHVEEGGVDNKEVPNVAKDTVPPKKKSQKKKSQKKTTQKKENPQKPVENGSGDAGEPLVGLHTSE